MTTTSTTGTATEGGAGVGRLRLSLAVVCLVLGVVAVAWPRLTVVVVALLFGIELIVAGGVRLALATAEPLSRGRRVFAVVMGLLTIAAGIICLLRPGTSLVVLIVVVAAGWFVDGVAEVVSGLRRGRGFGQRLGLILFGLISIIGALVLITFPGQSLILFARIGGWVLIAVAISTFIGAAMARSRGRSGASGATA